MNQTGPSRYHHSTSSGSHDRYDLMPEPASPSLPRPSASLIVLDDRHRVLLVQRIKNATSFGGMHVFPGGNFDKRQDDSVRMTAIRETFEETGVLIASPTAQGTIPAQLTPSSLAAARTAIHSGQLSFVGFLNRHGLRADVETLIPFTQWVTPPQVPRRFHTHFFVAFLPSSFPSHALPQPTSDGGIEVTSAVFIHPLDILKSYENRDDRNTERILLMPPQFYLISTLAAAINRCKSSKSTSSTIVDERRMIEQLARSEFGSVVINPRGLRESPTTSSSKEDRRPMTCLTYEGDEARGGPKGRYHRSYIEYSSAGVLGSGNGAIPRHINLVRNFDVFEEKIIPDIAEDDSLKARL